MSTNKFYYSLYAEEFLHIPTYIQEDINLCMCIRANFTTTSRYPDYYERIPYKLFTATMHASTDFIVLINPNAETLIVLKLLGIAPKLEENSYYINVVENVYLNTKSKVEFDKYVASRQ